MPSASFPSISHKDLLDRWYSLENQEGPGLKINLDEIVAADFLYLYSLYEKDKRDAVLRNYVNKSQKSIK